MTSVASPHHAIGRRNAHWGERTIVVVLILCAATSVAVTIGIVAVLAGETIRFFSKVPVWDFLTGTRWAPLGGRVEAGDFGLLPLLNGTTMIAVGSLVVGLPLGLATAIYLSE